jgi:arylsulfatase A-like enzyme
LLAISAVSRPNVLMIAVDDLNTWVGAYQTHPQALTPAIDRLAHQGAVFLNAHCQAPLCNPSRASLLTGLRPTTMGIYGLSPGLRDVQRTRDAVTLPQAFRRQGYFTAAFGKVFHDGSIPRPLQTNEFEVWGPAPGMPFPPRKFVQTLDPIRAMDWGTFPSDDRDQADWKIAEAAIRQIETAPGDRPFFIAVGFRLPHVPCFASSNWFAKFPPADQIRLPKAPSNDRADTPPFSWFLHWELPEPRLSWLEQAGEWRNLVRAYLASTAFMDSQVERVVSALGPQRTNTIVVLWSDNGWHLGEKGVTGKNTLWDPGTRVPLIFSGPGVRPGGRCSQPAELLDVYPTLLELCGLPAQPGLEGHSLAPQLKNPRARRPWPAITTHNPGNDSVRTERWRYIRYADGSEELYDIRKDPGEWVNVAGNPKHARVIRTLAQWLPRDPAPHAPGSASRVLVKTPAGWEWEGRLIQPGKEGRAP